MGARKQEHEGSGTVEDNTLKDATTIQWDRYADDILLDKKRRASLKRNLLFNTRWVNSTPPQNKSTENPKIDEKEES